jgi:hypothetical protein
MLQLRKQLSSVLHSSCFFPLLFLVFPFISSFCFILTFPLWCSYVSCALPVKIMNNNLEMANGMCSS